MKRWYEQAETQEDVGDVSEFPPTFDEEIYTQVIKYLDDRFPKAFTPGNYEVKKDTSTIHLGDEEQHGLSLIIRFKEPINNKGINRFILQQDIHDHNKLRGIAQVFRGENFHSGKEIFTAKFDPQTRRVIFRTKEAVSANDIGDVSDFLTPPDEFLVKIHVPADDEERPSLHKYDNKIVTAHRPHPRLHDLYVFKTTLKDDPENYRQVPVDWCEPVEAMQESVDDDIGEVSDFEKPEEFLWVNISVPPSSLRSHYGDAWIANGKTLPVLRHKWSRSDGEYYSVPNFTREVEPKYWDLEIPAEWCTPIDRVRTQESADDDIGEVEQFHTSTTSPIKLTKMLQTKVQEIDRGVWRTCDLYYLYFDDRPILDLINKDGGARQLQGPDAEKLIDYLLQTGRAVQSSEGRKLASINNREERTFTLIPKKNIRESEDDIGDVAEFEKPKMIQYVRVIKENPETFWDVGDEIYIIPMHHALYPHDLYREDEDEESPYNTLISWLDPDKEYYIVASGDEAIAADEAEPVIGKTHLPEGVDEEDVGDVSTFNAPAVEPPLYVKLIQGSPYSWANDSRVGEVFEINRKGYREYPNHYRIAKKNRESDGNIIPKKDCIIVPPPLQESTEDFDFGDMSDFEEPIQAKLITPGNFGEKERRAFQKLLNGATLTTYEWDPPHPPDIIVLVTLPEDNLDEQNTSGFRFKDAIRFLGALRKGNFITQVSQSHYGPTPEHPDFTPGTKTVYTLNTNKRTRRKVKESEDDIGDLAEFEEPSDFMAIKVTQSRRGKNYKVGDIFFIEPTHNGMGYDEDTGLYAYETFRKVFPNGVTIPSHGFVVYDDAYEIAVPPEFKGNRMHTVFKRTTEAVEDDFDISAFEEPTTKKYRVVYKGTDGLRHAKIISAPTDTDAGRQISAIPDFLPHNLIEVEPFNESKEDDYDVSSFSAPSEFIWKLKDFVDNNCMNMFANRALELIRKRFPEYTLLDIYNASNELSKTDHNFELLVGHIPVIMEEEGWKEEDIPHRDWLAEIEESIEVEDVGDVNDFNRFRDTPPRSKYPAIVKNVLSWIRDEPGWDALEVYENSRGEPTTNLMNSVTGEIRQWSGTRGDLLFSALNELGLLSRSKANEANESGYYLYDIHPKA